MLLPSEPRELTPGRGCLPGRLNQARLPARRRKQKTSADFIRRDGCGGGRWFVKSIRTNQCVTMAAEAPASRVRCATRRAGRTNRRCRHGASRRLWTTSTARATRPKASLLGLRRHIGAQGFSSLHFNCRPEQERSTFAKQLLQDWSMRRPSQARAFVRLLAVIGRTGQEFGHLATSPIGRACAFATCIERQSKCQVPDQS